MALISLNNLERFFNNLKTYISNALNSKANSTHTHSASDITDLETWNYDSSSNAIIVSGGTDTWSYDSQSDSIIVS